MTLLTPNDLPDNLHALIDACRDQLTIVSPRPRLPRCKQLRQRLRRARKRGVEIQWFYHSDHELGQRCRRLGIRGRAVDDLHCNLYLNGRQALTTTMSLHKVSDDAVIDIAYLTDTPTEYAAVTDFVALHLEANAVPDAVEELPLTVRYSEARKGKRIAARVAERLHAYSEELLRTGRLTDDQLRHTPRGIVVEDFHPGIALLVVARKGYEVVVLQPRGSRTARSVTLSYLSYYQQVFDSAVGHPFTPGKRGKRLRCTLPQDMRRLDAGGQLSTAYADQLRVTLDRCFGSLRDNLRAMLAHDYHLVG